ncbi:MAG: T9SS type A sorting domain-containing protein [Bacteroidetes bacterium]|nr:T9SS type A sorting domain-containing protein [Bacteroidota bacterium]
MMKKFFLLTTVVVSLTISVFSQVKKVLFVGNSYTAANNLPEKVSKLASSLSDSVYYDSNTPGGYRLSDHATNVTTLAKISQEDWDFVVIQAQSQEPSLPPEQVAAEVLPYAAILNDSVKSNNPCSETVFFMTWGRKYGDQQNCANWEPVCTFLGMQQRLMAGYMTMTEQNSSTVAPVGLAWKHAMDDDPDSLINLYSGDLSHPSAAGTYLTTCVMYAVMFQKTPVGSEYLAELTENDAQFLQQMAFNVVLGEDYNFTFFDTYTNINYDLSWQSWFDKGAITLADFTVSCTGNSYFFTDLSLNAESWHWDFGDGSTSSLQNPVHSFAESGVYLISLHSGNDCFEDTAGDMLNVVVNTTGEVRDQPFVSVFPNPATKKIMINLSPHLSGCSVEYEILNLRGILVKEGVIHCDERDLSHEVDLSGQNRGMYFLRISSDRNEICQKLIIR